MVPVVRRELGDPTFTILSRQSSVVRSPVIGRLVSTLI